MDDDNVMRKRDYTAQYVFCDTYHIKELDELYDDDDVCEEVMRKYKLALDNVEYDMRSVRVRVNCDESDDVVFVDVSFNVKVTHNISGPNNHEYYNYITSLIRDDNSVDVARYYGNDVVIRDRDIYEEDKYDDEIKFDDNDTSILFHIITHYKTTATANLTNIVHDMSLLHRCINAGVMYMYGKLAGADVVIYPPMLDMQLFYSKYYTFNDGVTYRKPIMPACQSPEAYEEAVLCCRMHVYRESHVIGVRDKMNTYNWEKPTVRADCDIKLPKCAKVPTAINMSDASVISITKDDCFRNELYYKYNVVGIDDILDKVEYSIDDDMEYVFIVCEMCVELLDDFKKALEELNSK